MTRQAVQTLRRRGASLEEAEDSVQDALLDACRLAEPPTSPAAWLNVVTQRRHVDHIRRVRRETPCAVLSDSADRTNRDPADRVSDTEQAAWLVAQLHDLPPLAQQVCHAVGTGLSVSEAADQIGITARAVEGHLSRTRKILRRLSALGVCPGLPSLPRWLRPSLIVPAAAPAVVAAILGMPAQGETVEPPPFRSDQATTRFEEAARPLPTAPPLRTAPPAPSARLAQAQAQQLEPRATAPGPVAKAHTPALPAGPEQRSPLDNPIVPVTRHEGTGPQSSGPVAVIVHCVKTATVSIDKIGC
jgi:RNA polymerase sigma factor (sigma-70 family)